MPKPCPKNPTKSPGAKLRKFAAKVSPPPTSLLACAHVPPGSLRVWWWYGPVREFTLPVATVQQATTALRTLTNYDEFRREGSCTGGLEVFRDGEWTEWHNADGNDIRWVMAQAEAV